MLSLSKHEGKQSHFQRGGRNMASKLKIGVTGCAGRMGAALARAIAANNAAELAGGTEAAGSPALGRDIGECAGIGKLGRKVSDDAAALFAGCDAVIDFTSPAACLVHAALAAKHKTAYVVGTTGLSPDHFAALKRAAKRAAIVQSFNMSVGVNLLAALTGQVARVLDDDFDIEIVEMHHRMKVDAPSGTALLLGEAAAAGRGVKLAAVARGLPLGGRDGVTGARRQGDIGFASLRGGNVVGDHTVIFAADDERIELGHKAGDRGIFPRGALRAALWARGKKPGLYGMADVLGIKL
jgi:4-hydroxy-tetrahydrodipicolinate reductase